ncbi:MAG TPA: hypothetical protein VN822_10340 [Candidatus Acidoferrales bacterium]|nr:hypothetical protein [Candidatus Acidoferrales bacterium]
MKNLKIAVACTFFLAVLAVAASAQMGMGMRQSPIPHGVFSPVVGSGAAYEITTSDGRKTNIEYAIVGKESVNGKDAYWMEWTTTGMGPGPMVMKMLTTAGDSTITSRTIMQMPGRPPMEMTSQMTSRMNNQSVASDIRSTAEDVGSESVTVPAGTFACEHYRMKDGSGDTWVSTKVNPFGVVKHQGKDSTMVLTKVITDAKDKIVGTPVPFNPMQMMQQMHPPTE